MHFKKKLLKLFILLVSWSAFLANAEQIPIVDALAMLQEQGHRIVYSNRLVPDELKININSLSLPAVRRALAEHDLQLKRAGLTWFIVSKKQAYAVVSGQVVDISGAPVRRAKLSGSISRQHATVDNEGNFTLAEVRLGDVISVSARGFQTRNIVIDSGRYLQIQLQREQLIEDVIIYGKPYRLDSGSRGDSLVQLTADELRLAPAFGGDSLRVVNQLPGMASVGVSARPRIRGGSPEEVLILLDGVELLEPFHLADYQGGFSSIDSSTVGSVDVYTGGFPVRYGNRMSGVIEIQTDDAAEPFDSQIGVSNFSLMANTHGKFSDDQEDNWVVAVRQGDLEELTQFLDTRVSDPEYRDALVRVSRKMGSDSTLTAGGLYAQDDIAFSDVTENAASKIDSYYLWARLDSRFLQSSQAEHFSKWIVSAARVDRNKKEFSEIETDGKGGEFFFNQDTQYLAVRSDHGISTDDKLIEYGFQVSYGSSDYLLRSQFNRGDLAFNLGGSQLFNGVIDTNPEGLSAGSYIAAEWIHARWKFQPSLRWDWQDYYFGRSYQNWSPRLGLSYEANSDLKFWLTAGRYYQPQAIHELQVIDGEERFYRPQSSDQAVLGVELYWGDISVKAESYFKRYRNPKPRYENLFNPFVLLPELEPDRIRLNPDRAKASGFDLELNYDITLQLQAILRYSYMEANDQINDHWIPRRWSQRNSAFAQLAWQGYDWSLALGLRWHSGWRTSLLPEQIAETEQIPIERVLNNYELRDYFSVDLGLEKSWVGRQGKITVNVDVSNLTERKNLAGIDFDVEADAGLLMFEPDRETLLPRVFSAGATLSF